MHKCYRRYVKGGALEQQERITVLDIGGADVNGSFRPLFNDPKYHYLTVDIADAPGVSIVLEDPYKLPLDDASVDLVLSGSMMEHCEFFWLAFAEMMRVVKPGGYVFVIAPSAGPIHLHPVDCYRFYPDGYRALAKYANCRLVDVWLDERPPWNDLVGVFARHHLPKTTAPHATQSAVFDPQPPPETGGADEEEAMRGDRPTRQLLADIHATLEPRFYLEIGVETGASLALAKCRSIGIDPEPKVSVRLPDTARIVSLTSDDFFDPAFGERLDAPPDLVLIDGMHLFEFALRDFINVERIAAPHTLVLVAGVLPSHPAQAERVRRTRNWTGDVWKLNRYLRKKRPDLFIQALDSEGGLLMVGGLNPSDMTLWDEYNAIIGASQKFTEPTPDVLGRKGAWRWGDPRIGAVLDRLKQARQQPFAPGELGKELQRLATKPPTSA